MHHRVSGGSDFDVTTALKEASEELGYRHHLGVVQCKDNFYGQHSPDSMPVADELNSKWKAWIACGALASEMESAALFIVGCVRRVRTGSVMLVIANQTRRELGLEDPQVYDTEAAVVTAVEAMRKLIKKTGRRLLRNKRFAFHHTALIAKIYCHSFPVLCAEFVVESFL